MRNSLQRKLLYSFMLVIVVLLLGVSFGVSLIIKEEMLANKQEELISKGSELALVIEAFQQTHGNLQNLSQFLNSREDFTDSHIWVVNPARQLISVSEPRKKMMDSPPGMMRPSMGMMGHGMGPPGNPFLEEKNMLPIMKELDQVFAGQIWTKIFEHPIYGEKMLVVGLPIHAADGSVSAAILLNTPVTALNIFMEHIYYYIGIAGVVAFLLALLVVSWLTRGIVRPLTAMQEIAGAMARGDYSKQVKIESNDEVGNLGVALNSLAKDLAKYIEELNQVEKLRRDFVANVSHEFRTPMTIIRGYNEALMDGTISDPVLVEKYHQLIGRETLRLERLVKDLLDLSRLQSTMVSMEQEKIPLGTVVMNVASLLKQQAEQKQVKIQVDNQENLPDIYGNGDRIVQLILIVVDNALKYTPSDGTITLSTCQEKDKIVVRVADTGIGIPAEDVPYIWERLYKVDKSHSPTDGGTGLGLAIGKQILELHHATATVVSELQQGTTVSMYFPLLIPSEP